MDISTPTVKALIDLDLSTQEEFAAKAGISRATLSTALTRGTASRSTVIKIAKALNVEPEELIKGSADRC